MKNSELFTHAVRMILNREYTPGREAMSELNLARDIAKGALGFDCTIDQFVLFSSSQRAALAAASSGFIPSELELERIAQDEPAICIKAGATVLPGIRNLSLPAFGTFTGDWKAETADAPEGSDTEEVSFSPLKICLYKDISNLAFIPGNERYAELLLRKSKEECDSALDAGVFGLQARSTTKPQGMAYAITSGTDTAANGVVPTWAAIQDLIHTVGATKKALGDKLAWVTSPTGAKILSTIYRDTGTTGFLMEDGKMAGYPVFVSDQASDACGADTNGSILLFGSWDNLCIRDFGLIITVDKFAAAIANKVRITFNRLVDVKGLRGAEDTGEGTDDYEYKGFSYSAIKAS